MDPGEIELMFKLEGIFMPYAAGRRASLKAKNKRMVHYTSAENLFKIVSSQNNVDEEYELHGGLQRGSPWRLQMLHTFSASIIMHSVHH